MVLLGDFLYARAFHLSTTLRSPVSQLLSQITQEIYAAIEQVAGRYDFEMPVETYERVATKTGALYKRGVRLGFRYPDGSEFDGAEMRAFGREIGLAFQIVDDLIDLAGDEKVAGKSTGTDVEDGKVTLAVLHVYREADAQVRAAIRVPTPSPDSTSAPEGASPDSEVVISNRDRPGPETGRRACERPAPDSPGSPRGRPGPPARPERFRARTALQIGPMAEIDAVTSNSQIKGAVEGRARLRRDLLAVGCGGPGDVVQIEKTRMAAVPRRRPCRASTCARAWARHAQQDAAQSQQPQPDFDPAKFFDYDLPEGWESLPPTQFRIINLRSKSVPMAEMTLTMLGGNGGGATSPRRRGQVGLEPATPAEIESYGKRTVLDEEATYVEFTGPYTGMGAGPAIEDGALYGAIFSVRGMTLFVKATGPRGTLEAEKDKFHAFLDSIAVSQEAAAAASASRARAPVRARRAEHAPVAARLDGARRLGRGAAHAVPRGHVPLRRGRDVHLVARGGALPNINRWAGQLKLPALDEAGLAALPRASMLGREAYIFEGEGRSGA